MSELLTRDDHLSELTLERLLAGELGEADVRDHLESCSLCQDRLAAIRRHQTDFSPAPLSFPSRRVVPVWAGTAIAMAAAILIYFGVTRVAHEAAPMPPNSPVHLDGPDYFRVKGSVSVEFSVKRHEKVRQLTSGDTVYPGDRLGFRVASPQAGHLMIVGLDGRDEPYLCYPQDNRGRSKPFGPTTDLKNLNEAVVLDDVLGKEEVVAVFCKSEIKYEVLVSALRKRRETSDKTSMLKPGCRERSLVLNKQAGALK